MAAEAPRARLTAFADRSAAFRPQERKATQRQNRTHDRVRRGFPGRLVLADGPAE